MSSLNFFSLSKKIERHKQNQVTILLFLEKESETSFIGNSEMAVNNGIECIDRDEIGKEIGILDVQIDNLVDELTSDGYIKKIGRTKIYLTDDGRKRTEI